MYLLLLQNNQTDKRQDTDFYISPLTRSFKDGPIFQTSFSSDGVVCSTLGGGKANKTMPLVDDRVGSDEAE